MFSKSTEYALRATVFIAQHASEEKKAGVQEIADAIGSPKAFTAKILQQLTAKNFAIISSVTGPGGGFYISDKAKKMSVWNILEAMGEHKVIESCVLGLAKCSDENPCPIHGEYKPIKKQLIQTFQNKTIAELANSYGNLTGINK